MKKFVLFFMVAIQCYAADLTKEQQIVAITILAEARGEGYKGMTAVAGVIKQRSVERKISPSAVCLQKYQFSCWNNKKISQLKNLLNVPQAEHAIFLAKNLDRIDREMLGFANHYYADYIKAPYWAKGKKPTMKIGKHLFFKL